MGWSTRELAEMAGTTVNTIRHYHRVGLLDEPERRSNGYKQYQSWHLARVIQIRRLRELGIPLNQVEQMGNRPDNVTDALRVLDAELAVSIARLQRARAELAVLLHDRTPIDVPTDFGPVAERLSAADRAVLAISSRFYDEKAMGDLKSMIEAEPTDLDEAINTLSPAASEDTRQRLAEQVSEITAQHQTDFPGLKDPGPRLTMPWSEVVKTAARSVNDLYNEAQRDSLRRAILLLAEDEDIR